jgi:hypothetical protein
MATNDIETVIRYDGPALAGHEIDVQELAPALLALAEMIQLTNRRFNGDAANMRVTVKADLEQKCFQLHVHIFQSLLQHAQHMFGTTEYKTAKEIAEFLDLIFPVGPAAGVFALWRWWAKRSQEESAQTALVTEQHGGNTTLISGDGNTITVNNNVFQLANDPEIANLGKKVMRPLEQPGYDTLTFHERPSGKPVVQLSKGDAVAFAKAPPILPEPEPDPGDEQHTPISAVVFVKTQRNEGHAQWELKWAGRAELATIDDLDWLHRFQAGLVPHDLPLYLDVQMDMITSRTNPDAPARFHVLHVVGVVPHGGGKQGALFDGDA